MSSVMTARTIAVVPLRDGHSGKTRLADELTPAERSDVVAILARHVVGVLLRTNVERILVVTSDPNFVARTLAPNPRLQVVTQSAARPGLNAAVTIGHEVAVAQGATRLLVMHADLPIVQPEDIRMLLSETEPLVLAPDRDGSGTNALLLDASIDTFRFQFGSRSRFAHLAEAAALGLSAAVVQRPGTETDLDTTADWAGLPQAVRSQLQRRPALSHAG